MLFWKVLYKIATFNYNVTNRLDTFIVRISKWIHGTNNSKKRKRKRSRKNKNYVDKLMMNNREMFQAEILSSFF